MGSYKIIYHSTAREHLWVSVTAAAIGGAVYKIIYHLTARKHSSA